MMIDGSGYVETHGSTSRVDPAAEHARVLLVDDDDNLRAMLREALEDEGYAVTESYSAERGLELLRQCAFDAVLADDHLPRGSGAWMLAQAATEGRLAGTPAFIVTGHDAATARDDFAVISKPVDVDALIATIGEAVSNAAEGRRRSSKRPRRASANHEAPGGAPSPREVPIELVLYISSASVHSATALQNIREALKAFDGPPVTLKVHDLAEEAHTRHAENVPFTPALLSPGPGRRTWIIGNMQNANVILEMLGDAAHRRLWRS